MRRLGECALLAVLFAVPMGLLSAADRVNNGEETDPGPLPPLPPVPGTEPAPIPVAKPVATPAPVAVIAAPTVPTATPVVAPPPEPQERHNFSNTRTTREEVFTPGGNEKIEKPKGDQTAEIPLPPPSPKASKQNTNAPVIQTGPIENIPPAPQPPPLIAKPKQVLEDTPAPSVAKGIPIQSSASLIDDKPAVVLPTASENTPSGDLLADRPGTVPEAKRGAFYMEMPDYVAPEWGGPEVRKTYRLIADMKQQVYQISLDLDNGGVETTRLKFNTEALQKSITDLTLQWEDVSKFKDRGLSTKRTALVLEEELGNEPRKWSHVRWAFRELQTQVRDLRTAAVDVCAAAPRPTKIIDKNGKEIILPPEKDPLLAVREAEAKKVEDLKKERDRLKNRSGASKEDPLGNKKIETGTPYLKPRD